MPLSKTAKTILANPKQYLYLKHHHRGLLPASSIWGQNLGRRNGLVENEFCNALNHIRKVASKRGPCDEDKTLVLDAILKYTTEVSSEFKNINQINNHLKGIFGCELPVRYRKVVRQSLLSSSQVEVSTPTPQVEIVEERTDNSSTSFTIGEVEFTLSRGAILNIGELKTKTLDFKGMKSVAIERVEDGKLFGVNLQS